MSIDKTKIECRLKAKASEKVISDVEEDLSISDPDHATGRQILKKKIKEELKKEDGNNVD